MLYYLPDSQDQVDPLFSWDLEEHPPHHVRQRDDRYAHEVLTRPGFQGLLVSKAIVDGVGDRSGRYTVAQRHRLYRTGVRRFFRLPHGFRSLGDCGAFTYVDDEVPPITADDALDFYEGCGFDAGISVDHIVLGYVDEAEGTLPGTGPEDTLDQDVLAEWRRRQAISLELADSFIQRSKARTGRVQPVGAAQGWSPSSYAHAVRELQSMGYDRIALGGLVAQKTPQILAVLRAVDDVRLPTTQLHLLGVTRVEHIHTFASLGVTSFDSTAPFRQAFMDDTNNYHWHEGDAYTAIRVPQVGGNAKVKRDIASGRLDQGQALRAERRCLELLTADEIAIDETVAALHDYHQLLLLQGDKTRDRSDEYRRLLTDKPWERCACGVCARDGVHVAIFRGTERNKRRGFHNVSVFGEDLARRLAQAPVSQVTAKVALPDLATSRSTA